LTVRLPTHLEQTKSVCAIVYLYVKKKKCTVLETVREANKIINNFRGEREVYNVIYLYFYKKPIGATISTRCGSSVV
jgi:hypothetical protein